MKKIIILFLSAFSLFCLTKISLAKVLSEDYLKDVRRVKLVNGYLIELKSVEIPIPKINPEVTRPEGESWLEKESSNSAFEETNCQIRDIIVADLAYEYFSGKEARVGEGPLINPERNLFVIDDALYRPDSVYYEYYEGTDIVYRISINELWLTDPKLPGGQQSTGGNLTLTYEKNGDLIELYLSLNNQQCGLKQIAKKLSEIVLLEVLPEEEQSATPL